MVADQGEVGARAAVGGPHDAAEVEPLGRLARQVQAQDRRPRRRVRRQHEQHPVEPARPAERRVEVPRGVRRAEDEHAVVVGADAVQLGQELVDQAPHGAAAGAHVASALARGHRPRRRTARRACCAGPCSKSSCRLRSLLPIHMSSTSLMPTERKPALDLAGRGPGEEGLAAAGRAVHQDAAADRLAELRLTAPGCWSGARNDSSRRSLDLVHAADVGEAGRRARSARRSRSRGARRCRTTGPSSSSAVSGTATTPASAGPPPSASVGPPPSASGRRSATTRRATGWSGVDWSTFAVWPRASAMPAGAGEQLRQVAAQRHVGLVGRHGGLDRRDHGRIGLAARLPRHRTEDSGPRPPGDRGG